MPLKRPSARAVVLGYLEAFDPDFLVQLTHDVPDYVKAAGRRIILGDSIWNHADPWQEAYPCYGIGIFEILGDIFEEHFRQVSRYPVKVLMPKIPEDLALFWASIFGDLPTDLVQRIVTEMRRDLEIEEAEVDRSQLRAMLAPNALFPRRIACWKLSPSFRSGFRSEPRAFFLDATSVEDIVDFWNLRALGHDTIAVPKQLVKDPELRKLVTEFLTKHRRPWPHNPTVFDSATFVRSRNTTMDEMQAFAISLNEGLPAVENSNFGYYSLQHWYPRIWDEWGRNKDFAVPADFYADENEYDIDDPAALAISVKFSTPDFAEGIGIRSEARCANEIGIRAYGSSEYLADVYPRPAGPEVLRAIGGPSFFGEDWRVNHNGLVKLVKYASKQRLIIPKAEDVMLAWLRDMSWKPKLSIPGLLAKQIFKQLHGNLHAIRNETFLGLLEYMNGGNVQRDGRPATKSTAKPELQRDIEICEVRKRLSGAGYWYDTSVEKGVFRVGIRVQCPHCIRQSWYPLDALAEGMNCPLCLRQFPAINNLTQGKWTFKTAGSFSVPGYADGAYAVLLAVGCICGERIETLRATPILSFNAVGPQGKTLEADYAMLWEESIFGQEQSGVLFGESKTYGEFKTEDFLRMHSLAKSFPGAVLVFSTLRRNLTPHEVNAIRKIAKAGRRYWKSERPLNPVLVLTGNEMLKFQRPPYCWEDDVRQRFQHLHGLLGLCNATQQLYLELPSWEADWQESIKRKHQKWSAKLNRVPIASQS